METICYLLFQSRQEKWRRDAPFTNLRTEAIWLVLLDQSLCRDDKRGAWGVILDIDLTAILDWSQNRTHSLV